MAMPVTKWTPAKGASETAAIGLPDQVGQIEGDLETSPAGKRSDVEIHQAGEQTFLIESKPFEGKAESTLRQASAYASAMFRGKSATDQLRRQVSSHKGHRRRPRARARVRSTSCRRCASRSKPSGDPPDAGSASDPPGLDPPPRNVGRVSIDPRPRALKAAI